MDGYTHLLMYVCTHALASKKDSYCLDQDMYACIWPCVCVCVYACDSQAKLCWTMHQCTFVFENPSIH